MSLASGSSLRAYEIVGGLGAGGMGEVYRARDTRLGREVALKVVPFSRVDKPELHARFEREARTLAALNNPHIAAIYDVLSIGDGWAIVMELVEGPTLADVIGSGPVPLRAAIGYAIDVCDAPWPIPTRRSPRWLASDPDGRRRPHARRLARWTSASPSWARPTARRRSSSPR